MKNYEKRSLALLGHGKWKSALGHTLLIIGMVLVSLGANAQEATGGLYMHKEWVPNLTECPDGSCGHIRLETFVTGESMVVDAHIPTDIVVVVDQSGSMAYDFDGNSTNVDANRRITALKNALRTFVNTVVSDAASTGCTHKIAIVGFAAGNYTFQNETYHNTELLTPSEVNYRDLDDDNYSGALLLANTGTGTTGTVNTLLTSAINNIDASGGTAMQLGLEMAYNVLDKRTEKQFNAGTPEHPDMKDRAQVVVFFTDGYPGRYSMPYSSPSLFANDWICEGYFRGRDGWWDEWEELTFDQKTVADAAVERANSIKNLGANVFSVGIFTGADPDVAYKTTQGRYTQNQSNGTYWSPGKAGANGLLHFISSDYAKNEATSWSGLTTSNNNVAGYKNNGFYMAADNADDLENVFGKIAQQSGGAAIEMGMETVVQDVISLDFTFDIPEGSTLNKTVKAYLPLCTGARDEHNTPNNWEADETDLLFAELSDDELTHNTTDGTVTGGDGHENKLPDGTVTIDGRVLKFTKLNFDNLWCGREEYNDHGQTKVRPHGRKLVIIIPLKIDGNTWGDGLETNGPMSVVLPNGDELTPIEFNKPTADVVGEVWTEVVIKQPPTFKPDVDPIPLTTPEDLAWFISYVNGRKGYVDNPDVDPHPTANAILMADVDMSQHNWVPIGINPIKKPGETQVVVSYEGTFDGNGHVITGLKNNASKKYMDGEASWVFPGMFNKVSGTVKNVFVLDADFRGQQRENFFVHHGIIADTLLEGGNIFNCEAAGRITCNNKNPDTDVNLIFGGLVGLNQGTVHSCMAMAELTAYTMGGMIGENEGSFSNGFTNGIYHYLGKTGDGAENKPIGGIAAINANANNIKNCYVRFSRDANTNLANTNKFGRIVGNGSFTTASCYSPMYAIMSNDGTMGMNPGNAPITGSGIQYSTTLAPSLMREAHSNDNMVSSASDWPTWTSITYSDGTIVPLLVGGTPLVDKLNDGVATGQASWKRTSAGGYSTSPNGGDINGDYPVLQFDNFKCLASADGIRVDYAATLDQMLDRHNAGDMNVGTSMPSNDNWYKCDKTHNYSVTKAPAIYGKAINLYANDNTKTTKSTSTTAKTMVYIDENVSLLQDASSTIDAYTAQTVKSFSQSWPGDGTGERWHNVSSSLKDSKLGWEYHETGVEHNWEPNPCDWWLETLNDDEAIFPTDAKSFAVADFYCFFEPEYHWINFRRSGDSHWHMDNYDKQIKYQYTLNDTTHTLENEEQFIPGKGYLLALSMEYFTDHYLAAETKHEQFLQNRGTLNNGLVEIDVTADAPEWTGLKGYNLIGNPYQSYLDFEKFITENTGEGKIWSGDEAFAQTYAVYDPEAATYLQYKESTSKEAKAADQNINMHQGFMIRVSKAGTAKFTNDMRTNTKGNGFRGTENHYPLINFTLNNGTTNDVAVLELGRPENDGALKLRVGDTKGRISLRHDNQDFGILFRDITEGSQPLYFDTDEDGTFTLSWNTANADFSSLTLVDNLTGVKYDMLANDSYSFEGKASDYRSRFKVVIGRFTDVEENEEVVTDNFAFYDGSDWVVNGQGQLTVTDMTGRTVYTSNLTNDQNRVSLNGVANGVYLMRVANGQNVNVQKIIIK